MQVYKVGTGSVLRCTDSDQHGARQLDRIPSVDAPGRRSPTEFDAGASGEDNIDFANTMLYVKAKITRVDGTNLADDSPIGPCNLFLHSLFSQVDVSLNGTLITASTTLIRIAP